MFNVQWSYEYQQSSVNTVCTHQKLVQLISASLTCLSVYGWLNNLCKNENKLNTKSSNVLTTNPHQKGDRAAPRVVWKNTTNESAMIGSEISTWRPPRMLSSVRQWRLLPSFRHIFLLSRYSTLCKTCSKKDAGPLSHMQHNYRWWVWTTSCGVNN